MTATLELTYPELGQLEDGLVFLIDELRDRLARHVGWSVTDTRYADYAVSTACRLRRAELLYRRLTSPPHYTICVGVDSHLPAVYRTPPVHHPEEAA